MGKHKLREMALLVLRGVGDEARGQWEEWTGNAYHVRRRLSETEEAATGPAVDVRGTPEAIERIRRVQKAAPYMPNDFLLSEM